MPYLLALTGINKRGSILHSLVGNLRGDQLDYQNGDRLPGQHRPVHHPCRRRLRERSLLSKLATAGLTQPAGATQCADALDAEVAEVAERFVFVDCVDGANCSR